MKRVKSISFSRGLTDNDFEKLSVILEEEFGIDCEPIYEANEFEKELVRVSRKLIQMGEVFTEEESKRDMERITKKLIYFFINF